MYRKADENSFNLQVCEYFVYGLESHGFDFINVSLT